MNGIFHVVSSISTTGFAISDNNTWPAFAAVLMVIISVPCGMAGSTTGGVKADRIYLMLKTIGQQVKKALHPASINQVHVGSHILTNEEVYPHLVYIALYFVTIAISVALSIVSGVTIDASVAACISALSNVGPALGDWGTLGSFNSAPVMAKFIFVVDMFLGRVEIYPILAVVAMAFSRRNK